MLQRDEVQARGRSPRWAAPPLCRAAWACLAVIAAAAVLARWGGSLAVPATAAVLLLAPLTFGPARLRRSLLRPRLKRMPPGLLDGLAASATLLPAFLLAVWGLGFLEPGGVSAGSLARRIPQELALVAFPEEFFFRGYLQRALAPLPCPKVRVMGARCGVEIPIAAALFALAHLVVACEARSLLVFFPGLVFGWLYARRRSLAGPAIFHAACNLSLAVCPSLL